MASRAETVRRKKHRNEIMALADTPKREGTGRKKRAATRAEREPDGQALIARARRMGLTSKDSGKMRDQMLGEDAGMALSLQCSPTLAKQLWQHYVAITSAEAKYHRSIGKSIHPKCAKIEMMQERFEVSAADTIDLRSEEERDRAAQATWMRWQGKIGHLNARQQTAIQQAVRGGVDLVVLGKVTPHGDRFVYAMMALDAVIG